MKNTMLAVTLLFAGAALQAQETLPETEDVKPVKVESTQPRIFVQLDIDQNGSISRQEAQANSALAALFDKLDVNQDNQLSLQEFEAIDSL